MKLLSFAALTVFLSAPLAHAQSQGNETEEAVDYSKDPSYTAARDFFRMIGADKARQKDDVKSEPGVSFDPWPQAPDVEGWSYHYLILQGENYLPVQQAYVTPFLTLFSLQDGYMPSSGAGGASQQTACNSKGADNAAKDSGSAQSVMVADEAVATQKAGPAIDAGQYGCPNIYGEIWGSGSQVMDKDHNVLAEQWFKDGTKAIITDGWVWPDDHVNPRDEAAFGKVEFLAIAEGGAGRIDDPAIQPLPVKQMIIVDYPVLRRGGDDKSGHRQGEVNKKEPYIPGAPELPVTVFGGPLTGEPTDEPSDYEPLDDLLDALEGLVKKKVEEADASDSDTEFLLIHRSVPDLLEEDPLERVRKIRKKLQQEGKVTVVSVGQEIPICDGDDDQCWSLNRSTILYLINKP